MTCCCLYLAPPLRQEQIRHGASATCEGCRSLCSPPVEVLLLTGHCPASLPVCFSLRLSFRLLIKPNPKISEPNLPLPTLSNSLLPYLSPPLPVPPCFSRIDLAVLPSRPPSSQYGEDSTPLPSDNAMAAGGTAASQRAVPPCTGTSSFSYPLHSCVLSLPCLSLNVSRVQTSTSKTREGPE